MPRVRRPRLTIAAMQHVMRTRTAAVLGATIGWNIRQRDDRELLLQTVGPRSPEVLCLTCSTRHAQHVSLGRVVQEGPPTSALLEETSRSS